MEYKKYKRVFMIVMDSLGIGAMEDADKYGDAGTNTFVHTSVACSGLKIPTLNSLGIYDLDIPLEDKVEADKNLSILLSPENYDRHVKVLAKRFNDDLKWKRDDNNEKKN